MRLTVVDWWGSGGGGRGGVGVDVFGSGFCGGIGGLVVAGLLRGLRKTLWTHNG